MVQPITNTALAPVVRSGASQHPWARNALIALLFVAVMSTGAHFVVGGITLSLERLLGLALLPTLIFVTLKSSSFHAARDALSLWFLWCLIETLSAVFSSDLTRHLTFLLIAFIPTAVFAFLGSRRLDTDFVDRCVRWLLWAHGVLGLVVLAIHARTSTDIGPVTLVDATGRLMLFVVEPNLFASGIAFLILLALPRARLRPADIAMFALAFAALLFARSKGPLLGFAVGVVAYAFFKPIAARKGSARNLVLFAWLAVAALTLLIMFSNQVGDVYAGTLQRADTVRVRQYFLLQALDRFYGAPILGRGPGDFSLQNPAALKLFGGEAVGENMWIWQMFVNIMHDSGVIGLLVYCAFLFAAVRTGFGWIKRGSVDHCGYMAAFLSILVSSQAATVHLNTIFGLACGLLVAAPYAIRRPQGTPAQRRRPHLPLTGTLRPRI